MYEIVDFNWSYKVEETSSAADRCVMLASLFEIYWLHEVLLTKVTACMRLGILTGIAVIGT